MPPIIPLFSLGGVGGNALQCPTIDETTRVDKILVLDIKIGFSPLLRLAMGKCGIKDGYTVSAAGGFVYIYTRTRKGFGSARAFPFADKFRKQNTVLLYYDKALNYSLLFRKQNRLTSTR